VDELKTVTEIEDTCFSMNSAPFEESRSGSFVGVVSLQSTTVSDFFFGVTCGVDSMLNCDKSSFVNIRGRAITLLQPKFAKITSSVIQKCGLEGIDIKLLEREPHDLISSELVKRKILIQANRLISTQRSPIRVRSVPASSLEILEESGPRLLKRLQEHCLPLTLQILNNKIYNANHDAIYLESLRLHFIEITKNEILKNQGSAIKLFEVRGENNDHN